MSQGKYRNYQCHCGSGKKYKKCHLWLDEVKETREGLKTIVSPRVSSLIPKTRGNAL